MSLGYLMMSNSKEDIKDLGVTITGLGSSLENPPLAKMGPSE